MELETSSPERIGSINIDPRDVDRLLVDDWLPTNPKILLKRENLNLGKVFTIDRDVVYVAWNRDARVQYFSDWALEEKFTLRAENVWRRRPSSIGRNFAQLVVFNYILRDYKSIESDKNQTDDAIWYWSKILRTAATEKMKVELIDDIRGTKNKFDPKKEDISDWLARMLPIAYDSPRSRNMRWKVSK